MAQKEKRMDDEEDEGMWRGSVRSARDALVHTRDRTNTFVHENPWASVAIAAAVGAGVALGVAALVGSRRETSFMERLKNLF